MPCFSYNRGHLTVLRRGVWYYQSDGVPVDDDLDRPCARCGRPPSPEGYDACMGYVPGVSSACCGHGEGPGFVIWRDGAMFSRWAEKIEVGDGCWTWVGAKDRDGYGQFRYTPQFQGKAHRFAYATLVRPIPRGLSVLHHCDNPSCVRPSHLYAGTNSDNMRDRARRGRFDPRSVVRHHRGADPAKWAACVCLGCGKVFQRRASEILWHPRTFCSRACYRLGAHLLPGRGRHDPFVIMDNSPDTELDKCASFEPETVDTPRDTPGRVR